MKHLVAIIDGTWLSAADESQNGFSNAYNLNWLLHNVAEDGEPQIVLYFSGIGTDKSTSTYLAGATARGIDHLTREVYINICSNFRPAYSGNKRDKIYLFGFSRGGVVARAIAGLIDTCGLLKPSKMYLFPQIWNAYVNGKTLTNRLQSATYQNVKVEILGVFDCVFGVKNQAGRFYTLKFSDYKLAASVKTAIHLVSIDETRPAFRPMLFSGKKDRSSIIEQIWMPGVHSDVGGTYIDRHLGNVALITMIDRIIHHTDLKFDLESIRQFSIASDSLVRVNDEYTLGWKFIAPSPYRRKFDPSIHDQYIHPAVTSLYDNEIRIFYKKHKKQIAYPLDNSFIEAPQFDNFTTEYQWEQMLGY